MRRGAPAPGWCTPRGTAACGSEERRVGKECRSRWWPCHLQKKIEPLAAVRSELEGRFGPRVLELDWLSLGIDVEELAFDQPDRLIGFCFSSRRRHTRWTGDWSSDVCSSDLTAARNSGCSSSHAQASASEVM